MVYGKVMISTFFLGCLLSSESICSNDWWVSNTLQVCLIQKCAIPFLDMENTVWSSNDKDCSGIFRFSHASELLWHEKAFHFRLRVLFLNKTIFYWRLPLIANRKVYLMWHRMRVWLFLSHWQLLPRLIWRLPQHSFLQWRKYNILALCIVFFAPFILQWPFTLLAGKIWHMERGGTVTTNVSDV